MSDKHFLVEMASEEICTHVILGSTSGANHNLISIGVTRPESILFSPEDPILSHSLLERIKEKIEPEDRAIFSFIQADRHQLTDVWLLKYVWRDILEHFPNAHYQFDRTKITLDRLSETKSFKEIDNLINLHNRITRFMIQTSFKEHCDLMGLTLHLSFNRPTTMKAGIFFMVMSQIMIQKYEKSHDLNDIERNELKNASIFLTSSLGKVRNIDTRIHDLNLDHPCFQIIHQICENVEFFHSFIDCCLAIKTQNNKNIEFSEESQKLPIRQFKKMLKYMDIAMNDIAQKDKIISNDVMEIEL